MVFILSIIFLLTLSSALADINISSANSNAVLQALQEIVKDVQSVREQNVDILNVVNRLDVWEQNLKLY